MRPPLLILALLSLLPSPSHAWTATGHQVVAQIAWRDLKPAARDRVLAMLKQHPHYASLIEPSDVKPDDPAYAERAFMHAAVWADRLRILDVNGDSFEVRGVGYPDADVVPLLRAVNTAFDPATIHDPTPLESKEFLTGRRHPWAEDRVM